jgi:thiamine-phosphate pyrophosphorylase
LSARVIPKLCYVTDGARGTGGRKLAEVNRAAARGGVDLVVLRERALSDTGWCELAAALEPLRRAGLRVVASRRLDLARGLGLDGVHLAADAVPVAEARAWLGADALIGYSAHDGAEARRAREDGADYATLSPIWPTESKPGAPARGTAWLARAAAEAGLPVLALGGVTAARAPEARRAGAHGVAAVSAIGAADDVESAARDFARALAEATA